MSKTSRKHVGNTNLTTLSCNNKLINNLEQKMHIKNSRGKKTGELGKNFTNMKQENDAKNFLYLAQFFKLKQTNATKKTIITQKHYTAPDNYKTKTHRNHRRYKK